jgi:hypothetical protein
MVWESGEGRPEEEQLARQDETCHHGKGEVIWKQPLESRETPAPERVKAIGWVDAIKRPAPPFGGIACYLDVVK